MRIRDIFDRACPPAILGGCLLGSWQYATIRYDVPSVILPSPVEVALAGAASLPELLSAAAVTALTAGLGLLLGSIVGVVLAFWMVESRVVRSTCLPYVIGLRIAPVVAVAPLVFLWFGRGAFARALVAATLVLFPVIVATLDGLRSVPREYLDLARSVDASPRRVFLSVRVPAAAPTVVAGAKIAASLAVVGAVVTEFIALRTGLGYAVFDAAIRLRTAEMYAALAALSVLGLAFYAAPSGCLWLVERR